MGTKSQEGHFYADLQKNVEMHESEEFPGQFETDVAAFIDPRTNDMGVRILCCDESLEIDDDVLTKLNDSEEYHYLRNLLGIPESGKEIGDKLPLGLHMHHLNGISFNKGCYLGHELTQRTFHTGVIRKIAMPFVILTNNDGPLTVDTENFMPFHLIDQNFDIDVKDEIIEGNYFTTSTDSQ